MRSMASLSDTLPDDKKHLMGKLNAHIKEVMSTTSVTSMPTKPDCKFAPPFNTDVVEYGFDNFVPKNGDVLIASYPKTGTTWLREISRRICFHDDEEMMKTAAIMEIPFLSYLECGSKEKFEIVDALGLKRRVWGTHLTSDNVNMEKLTKHGVKIVYVMRNPKDMIVSMKKFFEGMAWFDSPEFKPLFKPEWKDFVQLLVDGKVPLQMKEGEWYPYHIRSWMQHKGEPNFHFVFYEDMKKNPHEEIARLCKFLEVPLTDENISHVVEATSFQSMLKSSKLAGGGDVKMFRKGGVGNWKEHFTVSQSEMVDRKMAEGLADLKIDFKYTL